MDFLKHDLAHEFPQHLEKMRALRASDAHFSKLFVEYDADDRTIKKYEMGTGAISDEALEALKKKRGKLG